MTRILIETAIGGAHGFGHAVRMRALARALAEGGAEVRFLTTDAALAAFVRPFPCLLGWPPWMQVHVLVRDCKPPSASTTRRIRPLGARMVCIDDPTAMPCWCDLLVAPGAHWGANLLALLQVDFGARLLAGWDYVLLPQEVTDRPPLSYAQRQPRIVFCAGGTDPTGMLAQLYAWSADLLPDVEKVFLVGDGAAGLTSHAGTARRVVERYDRRWLHDAALVVCCFGQTVYECLYWQTPQFVMGRTDDDAAAARQLEAATLPYLSRDGALDAGFCMSTPDPESWHWVLTTLWQHPQRRQHMHEASAGLIDGRGVERVAQAIIALGD